MLLLDHGQDHPTPEQAPAALTLQAGAGVRGLLISYPGLHQDLAALDDGAERVRPFPWCIRGTGPGVYVQDLTFREVYNAIDLATARCDDHLIRGVWGTVLNRGIQVGSGSRNGHLERVALDIGPANFGAAARQNAFLHDHADTFLFGDCDGQRTFGLATFHPRTHVRLLAENGTGCRNAEFWLSIFDVSRDAGVEVDWAEAVDFLGLFVTGSGGGALNWIEFEDNAPASVRVLGSLVQHPYQNHALPLGPDRLQIHGQTSLCHAPEVTATADQSLPGRPPTAVLDRDPGTAWHAPAGSVLTIDLGRACTIRRWRVENAGLVAPPDLNTRSLTLRAGRLPNDLQTVAEVTDNTFAWIDLPLEPAPVLARYVQLVVHEGTQADGDGLIRVESLDLFGEPATAVAPGPVATVEHRNGIPTAVIGGVRQNGMLRAAFNGNHEAELFADAGVDLFSFVTTVTQGFWAASMWPAPDRFDFSRFDAQVRQVLDHAPEARLLPRLEISAPDWWREQYPDHLVQVRAADGGLTPLLLPPADSHVYEQHPGIRPRTVPSWASKQWRQDTADAIRRLAEHVAGTDYADRVVGYHLCSGESHEWFMWDNAIDLSPVNVEAYRKWLQRKYGHVHVLRHAWGREDVTFADAMPPTEEERARNPGGGSLRDPVTEAHVLDYLDYNDWLVADTIEGLALATREATGGTKLVGAFYGYTFGLRGEPRQQCAGHRALERLLQSQSIDFLASPHLYWHYRHLGTGTPAIMAPLDSVHLHRKLWYSETDIRTSLTGESADWFQAPPAGLADDLLQQRRHLSWILSRGLAHWWFDVAGIRYGHPDLADVIAHSVRAADQARNLDRSPVDQVAFVVDENSVKYLNVSDPLGEDLLTGQLPALCRTGAPVGHYALHDLARITDRRLFVFGGVLAPSESARRQVDGLKGNGRVLVFTYAPGLYRNGRQDPEAMHAFTGVRIAEADAPERFEAVVDTELAGFADLNGTRLGVRRRVEPVFLPEDEGAEVLARFADGRPAVVLRAFEDWTAVVSAVPMLPDTLLNRLAGMAGVHLYTDPGVALWASRDALAVSVDDARPVTLRLPTPRTVTEVWTDTDLGRTAEITVPIPEHDTRLFFLE
jgi:hypothetical protein